MAEPLREALKEMIAFLCAEAEAVTPDQGERFWQAAERLEKLLAALAEEKQEGRIKQLAERGEHAGEFGFAERLEQEDPAGERRLPMFRVRGEDDDAWLPANKGSLSYFREHPETYEVLDFVPAATQQQGSTNG